MLINHPDTRPVKLPALIGIAVVLCVGLASFGISHQTVQKPPLQISQR